MHRTYRFLTTLLCCILLLTLGCLPIAAAGNLLPQNQAAADETAAKFSALITQYDEKEAATKIPADRTIEAIGRYSAEAAALIPSDPAAARTEDLRPAFSLLYAKGALSAKLSWIAYVHGVIDEQNATDTVREQYLALCNDVRATVDEVTLSAHADDLCVRMNRTVFKQKINALPHALGIDEAHILEHLQNARAEIDALSDPDVDGAAYLAVYESTRDAIVLEQNRLLAKAEFGTVYDLLALPSADKLNALTALSPALSAATSTADVNRALLAATRTCLQTALPGNGLYTTAYRQALEAAMESAVLSSNSESVVRLSPYLDGTDAAFPDKPFTERAPIVFAKDRIEAIRLPSDDAALCNLLNTYVQSGGILDSCESREALDFEVLRATYRADWARKKASYLVRIEQVLPTASASALLTQVKTVYADIDGTICALSITADSKTAFDELLAGGTLRLDDLVREAEAERFRITHADILRNTHVSEDDRLLLNQAIDAFDALTAETRDKLGTEQAVLNRHYQTLTVHAIRAYLTDDSCATLRKNALEWLVLAVEDMRTEAWLPSALRTESDGYQMRAEAIDTLLDRYDKARTQPHYAQYDSDSVSILQSIVAEAIECLLDSEQTSIVSSTPTLASVLAEALTAIERHTAIAEIRLAVGGSSLANVQALLEATSAAILQENDTQEIETLRDGAIFRIGAYRKADEMRRELEMLKSEIAALRALDESEKQVILTSSAMQSLAEACTRAENAADTAALTAIAASFATDKQALLSEAKAESLAAGIRRAVAEITSTADALRAQWNAYSYLSETARKTYTDRLDSLAGTWQASVQAPAMTWESLDELLIEIRESMAGLAAGAEAAEEGACRKAVLSLWQARYALPDHYSEEQYPSICALLEEAKTRLEETKGMSALLALRDTVDHQLDQIPTRLDEAKEQAKKALRATYEKVLKKRMCYADEAWEEIEEIYRHSLDEIVLFSKISDIDNVLNIATERSLWIQGIRMDRLYSHDSAVTEDGTLSGSYPSDYNVDVSGYWSMLSVPGTIPFESQFSATPFDASHMADSLRAAVRRGAVVDAFGNKLGADQLDALHDATVSNGLSLIYTAALASSDTLYRISLLLPDGYDTASILGVVFIREDGCVEFYDCTMDNQAISFDISHFSDFYIVSKKAINLAPLIIILSLILFCEIVAILLILAHRRGKDVEPSTAAFLPISPFALTRSVTPRGGLPAVVILGLCIIAATVVLVWLIVDERERRRIPVAEQALLVSKNTTSHPLLPTKESASSDKETAPEAPLLHEPIEPLPAVTAELANVMMSDEDAVKATEAATRQTQADLLRSVGKKAAVNIDVISANFEAHDTVSLAALKKRGLLPKSAQAVKILARGTLDKPLTVVANDFSATAIKMILLTGGQPILVEHNIGENYNQKE